MWNLYKLVELYVSQLLKMAASTVIILIVIFFILHTCTDCIWAKCRIDLNKNRVSNFPLILTMNSLSIAYPQRTSPSVLHFNTDQKHRSFCAGGFITKSNISTDTTKEVFKCVKDKIFSSIPNNQQFTFDNVDCSKNPQPIAKEDSKRKCLDGVVVNIGYQYTSAEFLKMIDVCFLDKLATTSWAHSKIQGSIGGYKNTATHTPTFIKGDYFKNVLISGVYPRAQQERTFMEIFSNNQKLVDRYLSRTGSESNIFVKGHLVARADMFYSSEQYSTYFYLNVLPMWQSINNGNWKSVESTVRRIANNVGELQVWTGGIDVLTLSDKPIYLASDRKNSSVRLMPAPKLLFKVVYHESTNQALTFITVNDPYITDEQKLPEEYVICKQYDECNKRFTQFKQTFKGYTYCCLYQDFMSSSDVQRLDIPTNFVNVMPLTLY